MLAMQARLPGMLALLAIQAMLAAQAVQAIHHQQCMTAVSIGKLDQRTSLAEPLAMLPNTALTCAHSRTQVQPFPCWQRQTIQVKHRAQTES